MKELKYYIFESLRSDIDDVVNNLYKNEKEIEFKYLNYKTENTKKIKGIITDIKYKKNNSINYVFIKIDSVKYKGYIEKKNNDYILNLYTEEGYFIEDGKSSITINLSKYLNDDKNTNKDSIILYHVSRRNINRLKDSPLFFFDNTEESNALYKNLKLDGSAYQYKFIFDKSINILNLDNTHKYVDNDTETDLVSNPDAKELKLICNDIEEKSKSDGITIMDYSQINHNEDTESILIFHPDKFIKSFKKIK